MSYKLARGGTYYESLIMSDGRPQSSFYFIYSSDNIDKNIWWFAGPEPRPNGLVGNPIEDGLCPTSLKTVNKGSEICLLRSTISSRVNLLIIRHGIGLNFVGVKAFFTMSRSFNPLVPAASLVARLPLWTYIAIVLEEIDITGRNVQSGRGFYSIINENI